MKRLTYAQLRRHASAWWGVAQGEMDRWQDAQADSELGWPEVTDAGPWRGPSLLTWLARFPSPGSRRPAAGWPCVTLP